jgi:hypothetical protein
MSAKEPYRPGMPCHVGNYIMRLSPRLLAERSCVVHLLSSYPRVFRRALFFPFLLSFKSCALFRFVSIYSFPNYLLSLFAESTTLIVLTFSTQFLSPPK